MISGEDRLCSRQHQRGNENAIGETEAQYSTLMKYFRERGLGTSKPIWKDEDDRIQMRHGEQAILQAVAMQPFAQIILLSKFMVFDLNALVSLRNFFDYFLREHRRARKGNTSTPKCSP
jgi:hypothetical protein